jgi:hypothetical protein
MSKPRLMWNWFLLETGNRLSHGGGVGIDSDIAGSGLRALLSAVNSAIAASLRFTGGSNANFRWQLSSHYSKV